MATSGKLFVVPTPIGNLDDITLRALRVLKECDFILAEDTRTSAGLLKHFGIEKKRMPYHAFNEHKNLDSLVSRMKEGAVVALISDAGTPAISDPGYLLVRECIRESIPVECLPGPTALIPALVNSGIPPNQFVFEGFLPVKKGRQTRLQELSAESRTMVFYESPHRLVKTLEQFCVTFGADRQASVSREITKMFEETIRGTLKELVNRFTLKPPKGEFVIVVSGAGDQEP
jgi:16S rRNA (cytidine1402-2'-O)-methyltransferase